MNHFAYGFTMISAMTLKGDQNGSQSNEKLNSLRQQSQFAGDVTALGEVRAGEKEMPDVFTEEEKPTKMKDTPVDEIQDDGHPCDYNQISVEDPYESHVPVAEMIPAQQRPAIQYGLINLAICTPYHETNTVSVGSRNQNIKIEKPLRDKNKSWLKKAISWIGKK